MTGSSLLEMETQLGLGETSASARGLKVTSSAII